MDARDLIQGAGYDPAVLNTIFRAFDAAWDQVRGDVGSDPQAIEAARKRLALIVLSLTKRGPLDLANLQDQAVKQFGDPAQPT